MIAKTDSQARTELVRLASPAMQKVHNSEWSTFHVQLPSGTVDRLVCPLASAVAIEEAGYAIKLVGRLN